MKRFMPATGITRRIGRIMAGLVAFGILMGLAGGAGAQTLTSVRIGSLPIFTSLPLFTAVDKGYFKEAGIDAQLKTFPGGAASLEALGGGSIDIAAGVNVISFLQAREQGFDLVVLAGDAGIGTKLPDITVNMVRKDSGINSLKDFEGKRFGISNLKNINWVYNMEYLSRNGVDTSKITWVEIGIPRAPTALLTRQVDIAQTVEPFTTVLLESGEAKPVYSDFVEIAPGGMISVWLTTGPWAKANAKVLQPLVDALKKAIDYNQANQEEARVRLTKYSKIEPRLAGKITWPVWKLYVDLKDLQIPMELGVKYGLLSKPLPFEQYMLPTARPRR
jgi:NitT/TauT family transport system substrate-binding protein